MLRVLQISGTVFVSSAYSFFAMATFDEEALRFGLPPFLPRALAASSPAMVRSLTHVYTCDSETGDNPMLYDRDVQWSQLTYSGGKSS
jgi:hypothetical protein